MFGELIEKLAQAFDARAIPYMIIGGQAVLLYGEPRLTQDIDVTLGATPEERLSDVLAAAAEAGCAPLVDDPAAFAAQTMVLPCASQAGLRIDPIFSSTPYEPGNPSRSQKTGVSSPATNDTPAPTQSRQGRHDSSPGGHSWD
jgi:hypothetical protein